MSKKNKAVVTFNVTESQEGDFNIKLHLQKSDSQEVNDFCHRFILDLDLPLEVQKHVTEFFE